MRISDSKKIYEIQREFNQMFPNLRLEFFSKEHAEHEGSPDKAKLDPEMLIGAIRSNEKKGDLKIDPSLSVAELENSFHDVYGLNVQVYRRSGGIWLQTTSTDDWSLERQNSRGMPTA